MKQPDTFFTDEMGDFYDFLPVLFVVPVAATGAAGAVALSGCAFLFACGAS